MSLGARMAQWHRWALGFTHTCPVSAVSPTRRDSAEFESREAPAAPLVMMTDRQEVRRAPGTALPPRRDRVEQIANVSTHV